MSDEQDALDALEREASDFIKASPSYSRQILQGLTRLQDAEIDRIRKAFVLDAYAVLDLQPGVTESDIKIQYRKKSLLIHPDKTKNPAAPDAFDRLKKAHTTLLEEKSRTYLDECIADARRLLIREHKYTLDSPELKTEEFKKEWRQKTVQVLLEEEARRRRQAKAKLQEEGRERRKEEEEIEERKRKRDQDKAWEDSRDERIGSWRDFQKGQKKGDSDKKKKKKMKVLG
ncbi:DnaJ domain protein [Aspergillus ochraceoroseus]|uniref:DnaJ domain protein n=1 Tax=Aspergillus ochraceoroseus TaxID=138278 RepID=A0A0F8UML4_9EURO|nr:DnaJ domain protein [Aspergillus ochraceoroseus]